jgi:hypothetical protein
MNEHGYRTPKFTTDGDGEAIVLVSLANHREPAKLFASDFEGLMRQGVSGMWTLNSNGYGSEYVRCPASGKGRLFTVARLIVRPAKGQVIRYRDGNRLNLRRDNLIVRSGRALNRERMATEELA